MRRIEIREHQFAGELCLDRTDRGSHRDLVFVVRHPLDAFTSRDAGLEDFRIVERFPNALLREGNALLAAHFHVLMLRVVDSRSMRMRLRSARWPTAGW